MSRSSLLALAVLSFTLGCGPDLDVTGDMLTRALSGGATSPGDDGTAYLDEEDGDDSEEDGEDEDEGDEGGLECDGGSTDAIVVEWTCDGVEIESCKDLSNIVYVCDGVHVKIEEGLDGGSYLLDEDCEIVTVWVKAGANHSGDGPGYGQRFDRPADSELACDDDDDGGDDGDDGDEGGDGDDDGDDDAPPPSIECVTDGDCASGQQCIESLCLFIEG